jgi:hypothetical protein
VVVVGGADIPSSFNSLFSVAFACCFDSRL